MKVKAKKTKIVKLEKQLWREKEFLAGLIKSMQDGFSVLDGKGIHIEVNPALCKMTGFSRKEIIGVGRPHPYWPPEEYANIERAFQRTLEGEFEHFQLIFMRKNGERFPVIVSPAWIKDSQGKVISYFVTVKDISEQRKAEGKIKMFVTAIENARDSFVIADMKGNVFYANRSACEMFGYVPDEITGLNIAQLIDNPEFAGEIVRETTRNEHWGGEMICPRKNGERFPVSLAVSLVKQTDGKSSGMLGVLRDVTAEKKMQEELARAERMAGVGQLAAGVAHEFNNLINIISGSAEYALGSGNRKEIRESLETIINSSDRGAAVVRRLLHFAGRIELRRERVDITELIEDILTLMRRELAVNYIKVNREYADIPGLMVDGGQLQQVFLNLIINARNAMSRGGRLTISMAREDDAVVIGFHNTGKYIMEEELGKIFMPFYRLQTGGQKAQEGSGLGLSISYGIIQAHGGTITVESKKRKGTAFTIRLPIPEEEKGILPAVKKAVQALTRQKRNKKGRRIIKGSILVVDDEIDICRLFKKGLEDEGYEVSFACSNKTAVAAYKKKRYDLVYLDIVMADVNGVEIFHKIREINPQARIVFITGKLIDEKVARMYLQKGAGGFIKKPVSMREIIKYTEEILEK